MLTKSGECCLSMPVHGSCATVCTCALHGWFFMFSIRNNWFAAVKCRQTQTHIHHLRISLYDWIYLICTCFEQMLRCKFSLRGRCAPACCSIHNMYTMCVCVWAYLWWWWEQVLHSSADQSEHPSSPSNRMSMQFVACIFRSKEDY